MATAAKPKKELPPQKRDTRPPEHFEKMHEHVRNHRPSAVHEIVRVATFIINLLVFRVRVIGMRRVWKRGAFIMAPVHFSNYDHFFCAQYSPRRSHFMAKSNMFRWPLDKILPSGGTFPVLRKKLDQEPDWESLHTGRILLQQGRVLIMYPWKGRNRGEDLPAKAGFGIGWEALETGLPIVPVAIYNSDRIRHFGWVRLPKVTVEYGKELRFPRQASPTREEAQRVADIINEHLVSLQLDLRKRGGKRRPKTRPLIKRYRKIGDG